MRRKFVFMLMSHILLLQTTSLFAQTGHYSMLEGNPEWVYHFVQPNHIYEKQAYVFCSYPREMFLRLYVNGDTCHLNNHVYTYVYYEAYDTEGKLVDNKYCFARMNPGYFKDLRESDGKVFGSLGNALGVRFTKQLLEDMSKYDGNEVVLFDDDLHKGDTLYVNHYDKYSLVEERKGVITVVPITGDSLVRVADGSIRHMLTYECKNYHGQMQYMIEGIGFINPDMVPLYAAFESHEDNIYAREWPPLHFCNLLTFIQNGKVVYIAPRCKDDASYEEKAMSFATIPFYPDITPESVADGTYTMHGADVNSTTFRKTPDRESVYNLQGQQSGEPQRGLNIIDGRKVLIK